MRTDLHNHTCHFSPDAKMTIEKLISTAVKRHLDIVAITEHFEYDNPDPTDAIQTFDLDEYSETFRKWRKLCPPQLQLLQGVEFGYQTHTASAIDQFALHKDLDIVILSNHLFRGVDLFFSKEAYSLPSSDRNREYIATMAEMAEKVDHFDVAAHFDYVNKFNPNPNDEILYQHCPKEFDRFFEALITKEKALEINTATPVKRHSKPDPEILKRYMQMGGKLFTLGSDAHIPQNLGTAITDFSLYLQSLGIQEVCYFKRHRIHTVPLDEKPGR